MYIINNISKSKFAVVVEKHDDHLQFNLQFSHSVSSG